MILYVYLDNGQSSSFDLNFLKSKLIVQDEREVIVHIAAVGLLGQLSDRTEITSSPGSPGDNGHACNLKRRDQRVGGSTFDGLGLKRRGIRPKSCT